MRSCVAQAAGPGAPSRPSAPRRLRRVQACRDVLERSRSMRRTASRVCMSSSAQSPRGSLSEEQPVGRPVSGRGRQCLKSSSRGRRIRYWATCATNAFQELEELGMQRGDIPAEQGDGSPGSGPPRGGSTSAPSHRRRLGFPVAARGECALDANRIQHLGHGLAGGRALAKRRASRRLELLAPRAGLRSLMSMMVPR